MEVGAKPMLSSEEQFKVQMEVDNFNKKLDAEKGRQTQHSLGKDDFLKLMITQLQNQDPTSPMENTEFISQMANFSSLEQMTNMNAEFAKMNNMLISSSAVNTIGKTVELNVGDQITTGVVQAVTTGHNPQVKVNGMYYNYDSIKSIY